VKVIYDSAWHHPFVAYVAGLALLWALARRLPFLYAYLVVFLVLILADATATGAWSPIPMGTPAYTAFSVIFIILGDLRYFVLAERVTRPSASFWQTFAFSLPISFLMPVVSEVMRQSFAFMQDDRVLYIVYEGAMVVLVLALDRLRFGRRTVDPAITRWVHEVSLLFAGLYFGWASSDVLILCGVEWGHLLRIVPNVLYYGALLPFILIRAPKSQRALS
jgi:hypothetical protein